MPRACDWCKGPIPDTMRSDAECCSTRCRQARYRFAHGVGVAPRTNDQLTPLRMAYADPPYPGNSRRYYRHHRDFAGEVDHKALIGSLVANFDGWALSTSMAALRTILPMCPDDVRIAAWLRGARHGQARRYPSNGWEPVIYRPGRTPTAVRIAQEPPADPQVGNPTDVLCYAARPRTTDPRRVTGAKPGAFARWVFDLLGALPGDDLIDVFPGSGGVARAWNVYTLRKPDADT